MPEPGNPQALNRYSYALDNALRYTDPTGHSPQCAFMASGGPLGAIAALVCEIGYAAISYWPQIQALTADVAQFAASGQGQLALQHAQQVDAAVKQAAANTSNAGNTADPGGLDPNDPWFRNARTSSEVTQSVLEKVHPEYFSPNARFGRAFYVAEQGETAVAEIEAHGSRASQVIRYQVDLSQAKVLDLTNSTVARAWGYVHDPTAYSSHQSLAQRAMQQGYNVIRYASFRGPGSNLALLDNPLNPFNYDDWLIPLMVSPGP